MRKIKCAVSLLAASVLATLLLSIGGCGNNDNAGNGSGKGGGTSSVGSAAGGGVNGGQPKATSGSFQAPAIRKD